MTDMARRFATRIGAIHVNRFTRIDSQKKLHNIRAIRLKTCDSQSVSTPKATEEDQFGNHQAIRTNRLIRANWAI